MCSLRHRAGGGFCLITALIAVGLLLEPFAYAQFPGGGGFGGGPSIPSPGPSRPSPGPSRPSYPSGGGGYNRPSRPSPYSRRPTSPQPNRNQPSPYAPSGNNRPNNFNFGAGRPTTPSSPYQPTFNQRSDPSSIRFNRVYTAPQVPTSQPWQNAQSQMRQGNYDAGRQLIDAQLRANRSLENMMGAVHMLESTNAPQSMMQTYRNDALAMARQQMQQDANQPLPWVTVAKFSLEDNNDAEFRRATNELYERFPQDKHAQYFHGVAAIKDGDWEEAERSLRKAQELGMPEESINELLLLAINKQRWIWEFVWIAGIVVAVWALGLLLIYVVGKMLSNAVLRSLKRRGMEAAAGQHRLRSLYRMVINIAGIYYYISLPIVMLLAITIPASIAYALLMLPDLSLVLIGIVAIMGLGGLLTALSGLRACFVRWNMHDLPGRIISREEAPQLWSLTEEVAAKVGTRSVDEIRLLPGTELAVTELGSYLQRLRDKGKRVLFLGAATLNEFRVQSLRSVLAHEYGHFLHRDTAGGDIALRVQAAMGNFADAIMARGKIHWWDIAVHFLRMYHYLFRRLSFGASRLQEVLADRVAVLAYGPSAMREGLEHVIRRSLMFDQSANKALTQCLRGQPVAISSFTANSPGDIDDWQEVEDAFSEIFHRPSTMDDTHPSPAERCQLADQLDAEDPPKDDAVAWDLFANKHETLAAVRKDFDNALAEEARFLRMATEAQLQWVSQYVREMRTPEGYLQRAQMYMDLGKFDKAIADLDKVSGPPLGTQALIGKALIHRAREDWASEAIAIGQLLDGNHSDLPAFDLNYRLGRCHLNLKDAASAIDNFSAALNDKSDSVNALVSRGQAHLLAGNFELADDDFNAALEQSPHCEEALRGQVAAQQGETDQQSDAASEKADAGIVFE